MDIGTRLANARIKANMTQEQVAEALEVSRQTISNWENEKTYPDIKSVIKMSDLYEVSLDHLLKEDVPMSDYIEYLEESTNVVKSKKTLSEAIVIATYLGIWAFSLIVFWVFTSGSDAFGYSLTFLWFVLPVSTFVLSCLVARNDYFDTYKWGLPIVLGVMYMLAEYATFSLANMIAFDKVNMPEFTMILSGAVISLVGMDVGYILKKK